MSIAVVAACLPGRAAWAEPGRWAVLPGKSQVAFDAKFSMGDFSGTGEKVVGGFTLDPADLRVPVTGVATVEVAGLTTGLGGRDRDMRKALEAERFPTMRFTVEGVEASFPSVTDKADVLLTIRGQMLIRDVERPLTLLGRARFRDALIWVRGDGTVRMTDFGIARPRRLLMTVADQLIIRFDLTLSPER
jgi:polyisoprenoid-binding protein YceI